MVSDSSAPGGRASKFRMWVMTTAVVGATSLGILWSVLPNQSSEAPEEPAAASSPASAPDENRTPSASADNGELLTVRLRYKSPKSARSRVFEHVVPAGRRPLRDASADHRFAVAVASAALRLRGAPHLGDVSVESARRLAASAIGRDPHGERAGFVSLLGRAEGLSHDTLTAVR